MNASLCWECLETIMAQFVSIYDTCFAAHSQYKYLLMDTMV